MPSLQIFLCWISPTDSKMRSPAWHDPAKHWGWDRCCFLGKGWQPKPIWPNFSDLQVWSQLNWLVAMPRDQLLQRVTDLTSPRMAFVMGVSPLLLTVDYRFLYIDWVDWQMLLPSSQLPDLGHHDVLSSSCRDRRNEWALRDWTKPGSCECFGQWEQAKRPGEG